MKRSIGIVLIITSASVLAFAQTKVYTTARPNPGPPVIDGKLDDASWESVAWEGGFTQREPYNGKPPSQETAFKVLYDDKNVYVGIRAYDTEPEKIARRLSRRDEIDGEILAVQFDSYFDRQTAFSFFVNAVGVKIDGIWTDDGDNEDYSPDPVWYVKTRIDEEGWTAEMRIPLSQLRYGTQEEQVWGLQVGRFIYRKEEVSFWQHVDRDAPGWIHHFGELRGIRGIPPARRIEILPYGIGKAELMEHEEGNPFQTGRSAGLDMGLDGKIGITSDLTMDFTVNPDFGQVEADPSEVNLTAYETFFEEKRPFFIEGSNILDYHLLQGGGPFANDNLFYSRRIGRSASHEPDIEDEEFMKMPGNSSILGAVKLTGKTRKGLSVGIMEAVTARERAEIDLGGQRRFEAVEPLTNYFLARMQKDFREGATRLGGIVTSTYRDIDDDYLEFLNRSAITGGVDFQHEWKDRTYALTFSSVFSHIRGTEEAILEAQTASTRYFQRPDADHVHVDSSRTSLSGFGGTLVFSKSGSGHIRYSIGATWRSPGLELNDMGFLREADKNMQFSWLQYRTLEPVSVFRQVYINLNQWYGWNFGSETLFKGGNVNFTLQFMNYWSVGGGVSYDGAGLSAGSLRGGPQLAYSPQWSSWFYLSTDSKKLFQWEVEVESNWNTDGYSRYVEFEPGVTIRPSNALSLSLSPEFSIYRNLLQYVDTPEFEGEDRYVFARIDQKTLGMVIRLNYCITPNLTIQYYGQPFISAGDYSEFKMITDSRADAFDDRYRLFQEAEIAYDAGDEVYGIDENLDGSRDYSFDLPDFNFRQFRSNLVIRWEYSPGSTLFLVWSQERTGSESMGDFSYRHDVRELFDVHPHDVFLIKFNRWFSL